MVKNTEDTENPQETHRKHRNFSFALSASLLSLRLCVHPWRPWRLNPRPSALSAAFFQKPTENTEIFPLRSLRLCFLCVFAFILGDLGDLSRGHPFYPRYPRPFFQGLNSYMPTSDFVIHDISVTNILLGEARLIRLVLPAAWGLARGLAPPDLHARHMRQGVPWLASGQAWYVLHHKPSRWAMELHIRVYPQQQPQPEGAETLTIAGHPAFLTWTTRRRGLLWKRHDVRFMTVSWYCPQTERQLVLEFSGWGPEEHFLAMREALSRVRCH